MATTGSVPGYEKEEEDVALLMINECTPAEGQSGSDNVSQGHPSPRCGNEEEPNYS